MKRSIPRTPFSGRSRRSRAIVVTLTVLAVGSTGALVATGASAASNGPGWFWNHPTGQDPSPWDTASPTGLPTADPTGGGSASPSVSAPEDPGNGGSSAELVGWASQNGGTTGGAATTVVKVSDASQLTSALSSATSQTVQVSGTIALPEMVKVASDKTIVGTGADTTITGGGLNLSGVKNVVVRNINFRDWNDDAINVQNSSSNIWIDHNSFSKGKDGAVDIKRASDYITVSWNRFFDHDKTCLLGHSDGNGSQDTGHLRVTYHHNWFDGTTQRHPRVRFANPVHVFNNYYSNNSGYGIASTEGAGVLVESNYFEKVKDPYHLGEAKSGPGTLVAKDNKMVDSGSGQASGEVAAIPYSYVPDTADNVKSLVTAGAGAGHL